MRGQNRPGKAHCPRSLRRTIRNHLQRSRPEKSSTYYSEYASGFSDSQKSRSVRRLQTTDVKKNY